MLSEERIRNKSLEQFFHVGDDSFDIWTSGATWASEQYRELYDSAILVLEHSQKVLFHLDSVKKLKHALDNLTKQ